MSTNIKWQNFKLTEADRARIKNQQPMTYNINHMKNDSFIALNKTFKKRVVA
jgi:hypothetical protein